ncbi:bactofilin family protein [Tsuneonella dongtanensis]|uniref:bactofilin family protein n=1 Tax=Tsuneonella dongtanensis TaxID=692370 RepID=UPI000830F3B0|nr:polymer-forming cytoskeletal protein [Tsuneonella dongtanensis]
MARPTAGGSTFSVIGSDVVIRGDIEATADLHIDGRVEGDIKCASLVQGDGSQIDGAITAETARVGGAVSGSITARELVVLRTAKINGDVHYDALTIEQGAEVEGRFAHRTPSRATAAPLASPKPSDDSEPKLTLAS